MRSIIEEVRWELDAHGYSGVKIFLSGGVTREEIIAYRDIVDAFGVGGTIANAPVIDFAMDIVEIEKEAKAKRGKRSGVKQVYELSGGKRTVLPVGSQMPQGAIPLIEEFIKDGAITKRSDMAKARLNVLTWLKSQSASEK